MTGVVTTLHGNGYDDVPGDDVLLAKRCADVLHKQYPGHLWGVNVNSSQGVINIFNMRVAYRFGFVLHLKDVYADPNLRCVMRAGGEILERAAIRRGRHRDGEHAKRVDGIKFYIPGVT